jgi:hypothetical protein
MTKDKRIIYQKILDEREQGHGTRIELYEKLEKILGQPVIAIYYNFDAPNGEINDVDVDFLEEILKNYDLSNGVALIINSPGGSGLSAERMITVLRSYCGDAGYITIVPKMAMSAATLVCFGSSKIVMSPTSSLGPIDPQSKNGSVFNILKSYKKIFDGAVKLPKNKNIDPYLQALQSYKPKEIEEYISWMELSKDIAINALKTGMLEGRSEDEIKEQIKMFLNPDEKTKIHSRCIYPTGAKKCGLNIQECKLNSEFWKIVSEINLRLGAHLTESDSANVVETKDHSYVRPIDEEEEDGNEENNISN